MTTIYLLDQYTGDGTHENPYRPACVGAFAGEWVLVTDQPTSAVEIVPDPNVLVCEISDGDGLVSAIENHPDYGSGAILYDIPNPYPGAGKPDANEYGKRRSYCAKLKISNAQFRAMFGTQSAPNTRKQGADNLTAWVKTLPKGQK